MIEFIQLPSSSQIPRNVLFKFVHRYFVAFRLNNLIKVFQNLIILVQFFVIIDKFLLKLSNFRDDDGVQIFQVFVFSEALQLIIYLMDLFSFDFF